MARLSLKPGGRVHYQNVECEVIAPATTTEILLKEISTGTQKVVSINDLAFIDNRKAFPSVVTKHLESISEKDLGAARIRLEHIAPLLERRRTTDMVETRAIEIGVSPATLYRWIAVYEATGNLTALAPNFTKRGGPGKTRISEEVDTIIRAYVKDVYDKEATSGMQKAIKGIGSRCENAGFKVPHETTLRSRIMKLTKKQGIGNRPGRKKANTTSADGTFPGANFPLDVVEIDHTLLDIMVVDEVYRLCIGRPYITVALDVNSRMPYGFCLSLDHSGFYSIGQTILQGLMPKASYLSQMGIDGEWEIYGLPKTIHADNGSDFRCRELVLFCEEYGIHLEWRPVARPQFGGHIERFIGTLNNAIHELPGTTFSNPEQRGDYKPEKHAQFTLKELEAWITRFIVNIYNNTEHSTIGMTPREKYEQGILGTATTLGVGLPDMVDDLERVGMFLLPAKMKTVQREGVTITGIKYFADVLRAHVNETDKEGNKVEFIFRIDPKDISRIYFFDAKVNTYYKIPYRNLGWPAISLWELKAVKNRLRNERKLRPKEEDIFRAYAQQKKAESDAAAKTKQVRRSHEAEKLRKEKPSKTGVTVSGAGKPLMHSAWSPEMFTQVQVSKDISLVRVPESDDDE